MTGQTVPQRVPSRNVVPRSGRPHGVARHRGRRPRRTPRTPLLDEKGKKYTRAGEDETFQRHSFSGAKKFRRAVAQAWREELELVEVPHVRRLLSKRLDEFMRCGHTVMVRQCEGCAVDRAGSGTFNRSCKTKSCPSCSWVRSMEVSDFFDTAFEALGGPSDYAWRYLVVTIRYDPDDPDDLSAQALRSRAMLASRIGRGLWKAMLQRPGAAMYRSIEVGQRGHVHLNLIYFGPAVDKREVELAAAAVDCRAGWCKVQDLDRTPVTRQQWTQGRARGDKVDDARGSKKGLKRVARYVTKGVQNHQGTWDEKWLGGDNTVDCIDPRLAARWEVATYRLQLVQRYGALRGIPVEKTDQEAVEAADEHLACGGCGTVGEWKSIPRRADDWIQRCHDAGWKALSRSVHARAGP